MTGKTIRVDVTADDIVGSSHGARTCPVARAMSRALGVECSVTSYYWRRWDDGDDSPALRALPESVAKFVLRYDRGRVVQPFSFDVRDADDADAMAAGNFA